jgi:hypothetical protein
MAPASQAARIRLVWPHAAGIRRKAATASAIAANSRGRDRMIRRRVDRAPTRVSFRSRQGCGRLPCARAPARSNTSRRQWSRGPAPFPPPMPWGDGPRAPSWSSCAKAQDPPLHGVGSTQLRKMDPAVKQQDDEREGRNPHPAPPGRKKRNGPRGEPQAVGRLRVMGRPVSPASSARGPAVAGRGRP